MDHFTFYRLIDGKQARVINTLKQGDRIINYKIKMQGYDAVWCDADTFKQSFTRRPLTEKRNHSGVKYVVTA